MRGSEFRYITVDLDIQEEGPLVYSFGYPLPIVEHQSLPNGLMVGHTGLGPRTTSAIIASNLEHTKMIQSSADSQLYIVDKALNYGNSGRADCEHESRKAFAICFRF